MNTEDIFTKGKMIAINGSQNSGKTSAALRAAGEYITKNPTVGEAILYLSTSNDDLCSVSDNLLIDGRFVCKVRPENVSEFVGITERIRESVDWLDSMNYTCRCIIIDDVEKINVRVVVEKPDHTGNTVAMKKAIFRYHELKELTEFAKETDSLVICTSTASVTRLPQPTNFAIKSHDDIYAISCLTGKSVMEHFDATFLLMPGNETILGVMEERHVSGSVISLGVLREFRYQNFKI